MEERNRSLSLSSNTRLTWEIIDQRIDELHLKFSPYLQMLMERDIFQDHQQEQKERRRRKQRDILFGFLLTLILIALIFQIAIL